MLSKRALGCCAAVEGGGGGGWALIMQFQPSRSTKRPSAFVLAWLYGWQPCSILAPIGAEPQKEI